MFVKINKDGITCTDHVQVGVGASTMRPEFDLNDKIRQAASDLLAELKNHLPHPQPVQTSYGLVTPETRHGAVNVSDAAADFCLSTELEVVYPRKLRPSETSQFRLRPEGRVGELRDALLAAVREAIAEKAQADKPPAPAPYDPAAWPPAGQFTEVSSASAEPDAKLEPAPPTGLSTEPEDSPANQPEVADVAKAKDADAEQPAKTAAELKKEAAAAKKAEKDAAADKTAKGK